MGLYARAKEGPTVLSSRVIRTLRANELNWTRLTERLETIEKEKTLRYLEHCHEIVQEKKRLVELLTVKKNTSISAERRKLLISKGFTIYQSNKDDTIHIRRRTRPFSAPSPGLKPHESEINNDILGDMHDLRVKEVVEEVAEEMAVKKTSERTKPYHFRTISPPIKTGSRQFFREVSTASAAAKRRVHEQHDSKGSEETKPGKIKPELGESEQEEGRATRRGWAHTELESLSVIEGSPGNLVADDAENNSDEEEEGFTITATVVRKGVDETKEVNLSQDVAVVEEAQETDLGERQETRRERSRSDCVHEKQTNKNSLSGEASVKLAQAKDAKPLRPWSAHARTQSDPKERDLALAEAKKDKQSLQRQRTQFKLPPSTFDDNHAGKGERKSLAESSRPRMLHKHEEVAYDARPNRSLSRGYATMQMTVGSRQVKVHIPKFTYSSDELMAEVSRAKATFRAADKHLNARMNAHRKIAT